MAREPTTTGTNEQALLAAPDVGQAVARIEGTSVSIGKHESTRSITSHATGPGIISQWPRPLAARYLAWPRLIPAARHAIETEIDQGAAFLAVPVCLAAGALIYFSLGEEPSGLPIVLGCAALAVAQALSASKPRLQMLVSVLALVMLGVGLAKLETWRHDTKMLGGEISARLTGEVVAIDHLANRRIRLTLDVISTERPTLRYAPQRVRASARAIPDGLRIGSDIVGIVQLIPISGPLRPGSYDFSFESYFDGLGATGFFLKGPDLVADAEPPSTRERLSAFVENARLAIADRIRDRIGGAEGEIAAALVVGVRAGIPDDVNEALRKSGLYHVISISGLHMALVAGTIMGVLRLGLAFFPGFSSRHAVKKHAAFVALLATGGYLFFSGAEVAAQRSFIMLAVMLAAVLFDRPAITMRNLAIAAVAVIIISPHEVMGPSFQMSFAAAAALIGAYAWWSERRVSRRTGTMPAQRSLLLTTARTLVMGMIGLAMTSLIAGLATAIFGAYHFQRVSPLGLGTNLVAMPVVSVLVMPFAVLAAVAMPFGMDGPFLDVMGEGLSIMIVVAEWFSERSPFDAVGTVSVASVVLLSVALLFATFATTWLRVAAVPFAVLGLAFLPFGETPDVLISEDGRLVAMTLDNGAVAINRSRPSSFTLDDWQRAFGNGSVVRPATGSVPADTSDATGFHCQDGLCLARHVSGAVVAHAADASAATRACALADLLIIDDATVKKPCPRAVPVVIGKRNLARRGSASVAFPSAGSTAAPVIRYAIEALARPWHDHRRFSRAARGLAPYVRQSDRTEKNSSSAPKTRAGANDIVQATDQ